MTLASVGVAYRYLLLTVTVALAVTATAKCVQPGIDILHATAEAKCPCYVRFRATSTSIQNIHQSPVISFLIVPKANYTQWQQQPAGRREPQPSGVIKDLSKRGHKASYKLIAENNILNETGDFVLVIQTVSRREDCTVQLQYLFESIPERCPPRLSAIPTARIIRGTPVQTSFQSRNYVLLVGRDNRRCSGSLIAPDWVLTAAHCRTAKPFAYIGSPTVPADFPSHTSFNPNARYNITRVVTHPKFTYLGASQTPINDIALVQLSKPVPNSQSQPYPLNDNQNSPVPNSIARASGYGDLIQNYTSNQLNSVDLPVLGLNECRNVFRDANLGSLADAINDAAHLCIGRDDECDGGICAGDSGGPLLSLSQDDQLVQVGVASYGEEESCGTRNSPDVFARVATYADWIRQTTNGAVRFVTVPGTHNGSRASNRIGSGDSTSASENSSANTNSDTTNGAGDNVSRAGDRTTTSVSSNNARSSGGLSPVAKSALVALAVAVVVLVAAACIAVPWRRRRAKKRTMTTPIDAPLEPPPPPPAWDSSEPTDVDPSLTGFVVVPRWAGKRESLGTSVSGFTVVPAKYRWR